MGTGRRTMQVVYPVAGTLSKCICSKSQISNTVQQNGENVQCNASVQCSGDDSLTTLGSAVTECIKALT